MTMLKKGKVRISNSDPQNTFLNFKEDMQQFFLTNPGLQEDIKNQIESDNEKEEEEQKINTSNKRGKSQEKTHDISTGWKHLSRDVLKHCHKGMKMPPSLETVNNRLNLYRAKIDKIDYVELLAKEAPPEKEKKSKGVTVPNASTREETIKLPESEGGLEGDDIYYFSFKKKMQLALQKRKELEEIEKKAEAKRQKTKNQELLNLSQISNEEKEKEKGTNIFDRLFNEKGEKKDEKKDTKAMEFKTYVGQMLYQTLQQCDGDVEHFKKLASTFVRNYQKKAKENLEKMKTFPPQIPKFTGEDTKHLNILLPDYTLSMYMQNKNSIIQGAENYQPPPNSPEYEFLSLANKVVDPKLLDFWKRVQGGNL